MSSLSSLTPSSSFAQLYFSLHSLFHCRLTALPHGPTRFLFHSTLEISLPLPHPFLLSQFSKMSKEERKEWQELRLVEQYRREEEALLRKWKEAKGAVLDALRKREVETIESAFQQKQLDLEKDYHERRGRSLSLGL